MSSKVSLVRAKPSDRLRLIDFLWDNFVPYEPIIVALGPDDEHMDAYLRDLLEGHNLREGHNLLAVDGDGNLLGVAVNGEVTADEYSVRANILASTTCEKCMAYYKFWTHAEHAAGFWPEGEPTRAMCLELLCAGVAARGRGVGRALIEGSRQVAREDGYPLFRMDCTSYYAAQLAQAVGMTCVLSLPYEDYKNQNGEPVFKNIKAPHDALKIFKERL